jgi:hypothetical protein
MVSVTTFTLDTRFLPEPAITQYGPFGTEADAQEFANGLAGPHRTASVTELSDPAQLVVTTKRRST